MGRRIPFSRSPYFDKELKVTEAAEDFLELRAMIIREQTYRERARESLRCLRDSKIDHDIILRLTDPVYSNHSPSFEVTADREEVMADLHEQILRFDTHLVMLNAKRKEAAQRLADLRPNITDAMTKADIDFLLSSTSEQQQHNDDDESD